MRNLCVRKKCDGMSWVGVVGVIAGLVLLVAILLPVIGERHDHAIPPNFASRMQLHNLSMAIEEYHMIFKSYPGYFDESDLVGHWLTSTENLVLSMLGGVARVDDVGVTHLVSSGLDIDGYTIDLDDIGKGPVNLVDGGFYGALFAIYPDEIAAVKGVLGGDNDIPEMVDVVRGVPILYYRFGKRGDGGPLVADTFETGARVASGSNHAYFSSTLTTASGEKISQAGVSLIDPNDPTIDANANLALILKNQKLGVIAGGYALISPGPDGIYFAKSQNTNAPKEGPGAGVYTEGGDFDDIVLIGGWED